MQNLDAFAAAWHAVWNGAQASFTDPISLDDTPSIPLARRVKMADGHAYETGALGFQLSSLTLHGAARAVVDDAEFEKTVGGARLRFHIGDLKLEGRHAVQAKPDPVPAIDVAGNLMDLSEEARRPMRGGADTTPTESVPEKWLENARGQREKLRGSASGTAMISTFDQHNETFIEVFDLPTIVTNWQKNGATKEMAADTYEATLPTSGLPEAPPRSEMVVNPQGSDKLYGGKTYNANAFIQQMNIAAGCIMLAKSKGVLDDPANKYSAASRDTMGFGNGVGAKTGNDKTSIVSMKAQDIHAKVAENQDALPPASDAAVRRLAGDRSPGGGPEETEHGWFEIDEEEEQRLEELRTGIEGDLADRADIQGETLFEGGCAAAIGMVEVTVEFRSSGEVESAEVVLPSFDFDVDDSAWQGDAGQVARERLDRIHFVRAMLQDAILSRLRRLVAPAAESALRLATA